MERTVEEIKERALRMCNELEADIGILQENIAEARQIAQNLTDENQSQYEEFDICKGMKNWEVIRRGVIDD